MSKKTKLTKFKSVQLRTYHLAKPTNPKDCILQEKLPMGAVPDTLIIEASVSFMEGALKYGRYNWRKAGVRSSVYDHALRRHLARWWNGEDRDRKTRVKHLASIIACAGILLDAEACGMLTDDRPPRCNVNKTIADAEAVIRHLKRISPRGIRQFTIHDT